MLIPEKTKSASTGLLNALTSPDLKVTDSADYLFLSKMKDTFCEAYELGELRREAVLTGFMEMLKAYEGLAQDCPIDEASRAVLFYDLSKVVLGLKQPARSVSSGRQVEGGLPSNAFRRYVATYITGLLQRQPELRTPFEARDAENSAYRHTQELLLKLGLDCSVNAIKKAYEKFR